jgi:hypothetical protein
MRNPMGAGRYRVCPLCEARNKPGYAVCGKCRTPLGDAPVVALRAEAGHTASNPMMRMLLVGGLLAAIGAGLVVRGLLNASFEDTVRAEEQVQAAEAVEAPVLPPPEVSGWTPGAAVPQPMTAQLPEAPPPAWSSGSFPVAPVEPPSDPATSMVGIAPGASNVREAARSGHVFTNDDLARMRPADAPIPEPVTPPSSPITDDRTPRGDTVARMDMPRAGVMARVEAGPDPASRVAAAQRRVLAIRERARATGQDLDDEMEAAIDAVREAQKDEIRARED